MGQLTVFIPDRFRAGLTNLLIAYDYAMDTQIDPCQFAVELHELHASGATLTDIRWLIHRGFAEHARETTVPGDKARTFRALPPTSFPPDLCVVLSAVGATKIRSLLAGSAASSVPSPVGPDLPPLHKGGPGGGASTGEHDATFLADASIAPPTAWYDTCFSAPSQSRTPSPPSRAHPSTPTSQAGARRGRVNTINEPPAHNAPPPLKPVWDTSHRELRYNGRLVKRFRVPAHNQIAILDAFQEDGWPEFIDDPIPPEHGIDPKQRLNVTIKSLNRNQFDALIRFHGNGNGLQVYWEAAESGAH